jgi:ribonuclease T1
VSRPRTVGLAAVLLLLFLLAGLVVSQCGSPSAGPADGPVATAGAASIGSSDHATPRSGLATVPVAALPPQAVAMLALIDRGGPFRYAQDGSTFSNLEGHLPGRPRGYYREYTVTTPGASDRGARRLIVGRDGDVYYTSDHYESFRQVIR